MIRTCPGYERYGVDENGNIVSCCRGNWVKLNPRKGVISLHGERTTTCKIAKFRWCVENQINPSKLNCVGALITIDGKIMTKSDFMARRNEYIPKVRANLPLAEKISKIQRHIDFCQASIDWLKGEHHKMVDMVSSEKENICLLLPCNKILARDIVDEAEMQMYDALDRGTVIDPYNWLIKRARGIAVERKGQIKSFSDANLKEMNNY